jgi:NAD(P)-dependent dehydrogenase (short-subunit alcohol dehydrogenase family)
VAVIGAGGTGRTAVAALAELGATVVVYNRTKERADALAAEFERGDALFRLVLQYTQALVAQVALTAACNRRHSLEQQMCRWFLLALDRLPGTELVITQELIASILGVRREGVTEAAGRLQRAGIIEYRRGHITVLRRDGLDARACECYRVMRAELDRLVPLVAPGD